MVRDRPLFGRGRRGTAAARAIIVFLAGCAAAGGCDLDLCDDNRICGPVGSTRCVSGLLETCRSDYWFNFCEAPLWSVGESCATGGSFPRECVEPRPDSGACTEVGATTCESPGARSCADSWLMTCADNGYLEHLSRCSDDEFPHECVGGDADWAFCREIGAPPCNPPGRRSCEDNWLLECSADGYLEHRHDCADPGGDFGAVNPLCLAPVDGIALCGYEGSHDCDPESFGAATFWVPYWGVPPPVRYECEGNVAVLCDTTAGVTAIMDRCAGDESCEETSGVWPCVRPAADADVPADDATVDAADGDTS